MKNEPLRRLGLAAGAVLSANKTAVGALALLLAGNVAALAQETGNDNRAPEVPPEIVVPVGNKVHFHGFGVGVQIYTWNGTSWGTAVPRATLFDEDGNVVAQHSAGPKWVSNSGSQTVGALPPAAKVVDTNSIPWLRLAAVPDLTHGPGIFAETTFIQRVNTIGGKAPEVAGAVVGQIVEVPYIADYFFFRQTN